MITTNKGKFYVLRGLIGYDGVIVKSVVDNDWYYTFSENATDEDIINEINNMVD